MTIPACAGCGGPVPHPGRGRPSTVCSPECRRTARAAGARARRAASPTPPPIVDGPEVARIRAGLAVSAAERASAYDDRLKGIEGAKALFAAHGDEDGDAPTLGDLGYATVRADRQGRTVWSSDPAQHRQESHAAREAQRIREACVRDAVRAALSAARALGVFDPDDVDLEGARAVGNARADVILAALTA